MASTVPNGRTRLVQTIVLGLTIVFVTLLCLGAVMWADGESQLHVSCSLQRSIDSASGVFTPEEVEARYHACVANANAEVRWSMPVCLVGAVGTVVMAPAIGWLYFTQKSSSSPHDYHYQERRRI